MSYLSDESCEACRFDAPTVGDAEREELLKEIPLWTVIAVDGVPRLKRVFRFPDYGTAVDFTLKITQLAQEEDHHPLIVLEWGRVTVEWWSHKIAGLHRNDFISAARTDNIAEAFVDP